MPPIPFRTYHLMQIMNGLTNQTLPVDLYIHHYFRANKALGSQDRGYIAETLYGLIRWKSLIDYLTNNSSDWEVRIEAFQNADLEALSKDPTIPLLYRISFPQELFNAVESSHGHEQAVNLCLTCNYPAPTTIRVNTLKISRDELLNRWKNQFEVSPCKLSSTGIVFHKKINFFSLEEFKSGYFEVQDEGSQLLADLVAPEPGMQVLDYCSGSGGKTLAFAPRMGSKGQIFLHDIRQHALMEARKRLKRAGIQTAQIVHADCKTKLDKLKKKMDWVLVDAPCTGTGTLRRNPDMKWKFETAMIERLTGLQRQIFERALSFLKPQGKIVYGTCSILKEENWDQISHFMKVYDLELAGTPFESLPTPGGMDGFFAAVLKRRG